MAIHCRAAKNSLRGTLSYLAIAPTQMEADSNTTMPRSVAKFIFPEWGIPAQGCRTGLPAYVAWRAVATTLIRSQTLSPPPHCNKNPIYVFLFRELRGLIPNFHIHVSVSDLYIPRIGPRIFLNLSQIYECRNWETVHFNSVSEITVSFLGRHKWEPDIYTGFLPALHLQCSQ